MDGIIATISAIIAALTFIFKVYTDFTNNNHQLEQNLREKRSLQYLEFLNTLSDFLGDTKSHEKRRAFLKFCYTMILVGHDKIRGHIEELLSLTLKCQFENNEINEEQLKSSLQSSPNDNQPGLLSQIILEMRADLTQLLQVTGLPVKCIFQSNIVLF